MSKTSLIWLILFFGIGIAILSVSLISGQSEIKTGNAQVIKATGSDTEYILNAMMPVLNSTYPVYRTSKQMQTPAFSERLSKSFDLNGVASTQLPGIILYRDTSKTPAEEIEIYKNSGGYRYSIPDKMMRSVDYQPDLPSFEDAKSIADNFLISKDLLSKNAATGRASICYSQSKWVSDKPEPVKTYDILVCIDYPQKIHELSTVGGTTRVYIGEKGEVVGVTNKMRTLEDEPVRYAKIISPQQAFEELGRKKYVIKPLEDDYDKITITNVSLVYWIEPLTATQEYVYPVYAFSGTAEGKGDMNKIDRYVWAIPDAER